MESINQEELKMIQISILDAVVNFCDNSNISYWLDNGTLLGAVRHKGYIPWDDDIDIGMLRPDYDRFMEYFNKSTDRYKAFCIENNPSFFYPHGKVLDTKTVLYEPNRNGLKIAVNIDVFPYDNAPDDDLSLKKMYDRRDFLRFLGGSQRSIVRPRGNCIRRLLVIVFRKILNFYPQGWFEKKMAKNARKFESKNLTTVGNFTSFSRIRCNKNVFDSFQLMEFEGKLYKVPCGYDEWLKSFYGDYMELPSVEKRISHHNFEAFFAD